MVFRSKIKWIALFVLVLSLASLLLHLSIAKSSSVSLVYYTQMASMLNTSIIGGRVCINCLRQLLFSDCILWPRAKFNLHQWPQGYRSKKLWGAVKPLASLQPYTNSRSNYHGTEILMYLCIVFVIGSNELYC